MALAFGKFGENQALWRVRNSRFALSPWCTVGRAACLPPLAPNMRLCIPHRRKAAKDYCNCVLYEVCNFQRFRNEQARSLQNINKVCNKSYHRKHQKARIKTIINSPSVSFADSSPCTEEPRRRGRLQYTIEKMRILRLRKPQQPRQKSALLLSYTPQFRTIQSRTTVM